MSILRRRTPPEQPSSPPPAEQVSFVAAVVTYSDPPVGNLRRRALDQAREFFGPGPSLEITGPWSARCGTQGVGYRADITVTATPRSAK